MTPLVRNVFGAFTVILLCNCPLDLVDVKRIDTCISAYVWKYIWLDLQCIEVVVKCRKQTDFLYILICFIIICVSNTC